MTAATRWLDIRHLEWFLMNEYDVYTSFEKDGTDEYWFDPEKFAEDKGIISIDSSRSPEHQLYVLLHEAGHVVLRSDINRFNNRFPDLSRTTLHGRLEILKEEVLAWDTSVEIADRLGIKIDQEKWKRNYRNALEKYTKWVLKGDLNEK